jgi:polyisoprenoid-binding protein YceI
MSITARAFRSTTFGLRIAALAIAAAAFTVAAAPAAHAQDTWTIDPAHANASFSVRHLGISNVTGQVNKVTGTVVFDPKDVTKSKVDATVDVNSIDTRNSGRDSDLKSDGFFDAAKYPSLTFVSTSVASAGAGKLKMTGNLTIHGVTKVVVFDVDGPSEPIADPFNKTGKRAGASATATINRRDFGIEKYPAAMIGDDIKITLDVEFTKK